MIRLMQGEHSSQNSFFGMIYEDLIPTDYLLCKLSAAVDFSFVSETIQVLIICLVVNCKKMTKLVSAGLSPSADRPSLATG